MLSSEGDDQELNWSLGTYTDAAEVWKAFNLGARRPPQEGVAPHQPSPYRARSSKSGPWPCWPPDSSCSSTSGFAITGGRVVHKQAVVIPSGLAPAAPEAALFTDAFFVQETGNLEVSVKAPVSNSWLYLDGALINEETGAVDEFDLETSYYYGADSDGSWSEGSTEARTYVAAVPPGRYVLRLGPQWEAGKPPPRLRPARAQPRAAGLPALPRAAGALRLAHRGGLAVDALRVAPVERERPRLERQQLGRRQ